MKEIDSITRRKFIGSSALAGAAASFPYVARGENLQSKKYHSDSAIPTPPSRPDSLAKTVFLNTTAIPTKRSQHQSSTSSKENRRKRINSVSNIPT